MCSIKYTSTTSTLRADLHLNVSVLAHLSEEGVLAHLWGKTRGFHADCKSTSICSDIHIDTFLSVFLPVQKGVQHETGKSPKGVRRATLPALTLSDSFQPDGTFAVLYQCLYVVQG